jgi:glycosyltransferase involved in cell wall biosynthesis
MNTDLQLSRVALIHDWLTGMRGGEKVLQVLAKLFLDAPIYTLFHFPGSVSREIERHTIRTSFLQKAPTLRRHYRRYLPLFPAAVEEFDLSGFELIVSSSHCVAKGALPAPGSYHLCYCHTPMRYAWDQEHAYFPRRRGLAARLRGLVLSRLRTWDVASSNRVDHFLANSGFVAERIRRYYQRSATVLHPPADTDFFTPGDGATGEYCLTVSGLAPYKRLDLAMAACESLGLELRVLGARPGRAGLERLSGPRTRFLGWVGPEELRQLYRGALCLLQPGVEDFGISSVEALACGTPVVGLARGGILDIVEDGTHGVLYSEADDPAAVARAIDKLRGIRLNKADLRSRAEAFSIVRFVDRLESILVSRPSDEREPQP